MLITVDLNKVAEVVFLLYAMGMAGFLGYIMGKTKGFSQGLKARSEEHTSELQSH